MNDIQKLLNALRSIKPTAHELTKIKILIAAGDGWIRCVDIRKAVGISRGGRINLAEIVCEDLLEISQRKYALPSGYMHSGRHYRTTKKGVEYVTNLMR
jgi:hypothetical protein